MAGGGPQAFYGTVVRCLQRHQMEFEKSRAGLASLARGFRPSDKILIKICRVQRGCRTGGEAAGAQTPLRQTAKPLIAAEKPLLREAGKSLRGTRLPAAQDGHPRRSPFEDGSAPRDDAPRDDALCDDALCDDALRDGKVSRKPVLERRRTSPELSRHGVQAGNPRGRTE